MVLTSMKLMMGLTFSTLNKRIKLRSSHLAGSKIMSHIFLVTVVATQSSTLTGLKREDGRVMTGWMWEDCLGRQIETFSTF